MNNHTSNFLNGQEGATCTARKLAYIRRACQRTQDVIANTLPGDGKRHNVLFSEISSLAELIGPHLSELEVSQIGMAGATANGYVKDRGVKEVERVIEDAIQQGMKRPREIPDIDFRRDRDTTTNRSHLAQNYCKWPPRTLPDRSGKPRFMPSIAKQPKEVRRHVYRRGVDAVRAKVQYQDGNWADWYRVKDSNFGIGWQAKKPEGFVPVPYTGNIDPFDPETICEPLFWAEGENDVDTLVDKLGQLGFTFGVTGGELPDQIDLPFAGRTVIILPRNDRVGQSHAQRKALVARPSAASVKIVQFPNLRGKGDVTDWVATGGTVDRLYAILADTPEWWDCLMLEHFERRP